MKREPGRVKLEVLTFIIALLMGFLYLEITDRCEYAETEPEKRR